MSWEFEDQNRLFLPRLGSSTATSATTSKTEDLTSTCRDALAWLKEREGGGVGNGEGKETKDRWELDFTGSYVLHAFDDDINQIRGWDHQIDVKYVLARQSNYARAVYPAVWHAVQAGIISDNEIN
jgi:hypothetical protein